MKTNLDKVGSIGSIVTAVAAAVPCCLPFLATVASAIGLGVLTPYSKYLSYAVQIFAFLALIGAFFSYQIHKNISPLILVAVSFCLVIYIYNFALVAWILYVALFSLAVSAIWNTIAIKECSQCKLQK